MEQKVYHLPQLFYNEINGPRADVRFPVIIQETPSRKVGAEGTRLLITLYGLVERHAPSFGGYQLSLDNAEFIVRQTATLKTAIMLHSLQDQSPLAEQEDKCALAKPLGEREKLEKRRYLLNTYV
jgi:hypothetical protein